MARANTSKWKNKHIGLFNNLEDAKTAREYAVSQYHGEFAPIINNITNNITNNNIMDV